MQEANATLAAVLRLPQCVEVEPDKGCKRAVLNLANGMTIQLPASGAGFSLWGKSGSAAIGSDCLIVPTSPRQHVTQDQDAFKVLAGPDLPSLVKVWEAQAKQLFGA